MRRTELAPLVRRPWPKAAHAVLVCLGLGLGLCQAGTQVLAGDTERSIRNETVIRHLSLVEPAEASPANVQPVKASLQPAQAQHTDDAEDSEIWIDSDQPTASSSYSNDPVYAGTPPRELPRMNGDEGEVWIELADPPGEIAIADDSAVAGADQITAAGNQPESLPSPPQAPVYTRIILGQSEGSLVRIKDGSESPNCAVNPTTHSDVAFHEPPLPNPWGETLLLPQNPPCVAAKLRESLLLNQTLSTAGSRPIYVRQGPKSSLLYVKAELAPETSGVAQRAPGLARTAPNVAKTARRQTAPSVAQTTRGVAQTAQSLVGNATRSGYDLQPEVILTSNEAEQQVRDTDLRSQDTSRPRLASADSSGNKSSDSALDQSVRDQKEFASPATAPQDRPQQAALQSTVGVTDTVYREVPDHQSSQQRTVPDVQPVIKSVTSQNIGGSSQTVKPAQDSSSSGDSLSGQASSRSGGAGQVATEVRTALAEAEGQTAVQPLPPLAPLQSQEATQPATTPTQEPPGYAEAASEELEEPVVAEVQGSPFEIIEESGELTVIVRRSKLLRTKTDVYRTAVVDSNICEVVQFTPREISILGKSQGATHVTFWFQDQRYHPITYLVRVIPDPEVEKQQSERYELLESHLAKLFPESKVDLVVVGDKLVVRGQARDAAEAAQIMGIIRGELVRARGIAEGQAADPIGREAAGQALPAIQVVNMLRIPGPQQVALKVKIAELNRTAARNFGVDTQLNFDQGKFLIQSLLNLTSGGTASIIGNFDGGDLQFGLHYLEEHGVVRMLSEPTLITLSGRAATFIAGGEFAVPTTVGVNGVGAVTTDFRAYGAIITFLPTVLDKDMIRLEVAPEFSQIDRKNTVNGTPGLRTRAVTTTVEMREGQTLAIAGLLDDSMTGNNQGDLPIVNQIFGRRSLSRNETELIILVTPELVHPMEPEEVPPLPGFDVTEPTNHEFYLKGHLEGRPTLEYDSTTWPRLRRRYNAGGPATISGPFGHGQ